MAGFRTAQKAIHPDWHNAPVPAFAPPLENPATRLLIVGLAPGLKGANRTGRPFTGDFAGDLLFATLLKFGLAQGVYGRHAGDGLRLDRTRITNAVRCVPPQNKPTPLEAQTCRRFLEAELALLPSLKVVLALGRLAHMQVLKALGLDAAAHPFAHARLAPGAVRSDASHQLPLFTPEHGDRTSHPVHVRRGV